MFDNLHEQFPLFSKLTIFIKVIFSNTLKNSIFLNNNEIKKFTKGANIEILILYFLQKNNLQHEIHQSTILEIFDLLTKFFSNLHTETFIKLKNPYNYLGHEIEGNIEDRDKQITNLRKNKDSYEALDEEYLKLSQEIAQHEIDNIILRHYDYKITFFIKQDESRKKVDPDIGNTIRIIHPISHEPIWFGILTHDSPIKQFIDFNVREIQTKYL